MRACFRCGRRYYRRNSLEAWVRLPSGVLTKNTIRICHNCMSDAETRRLVMRVASITQDLSLPRIQRRLAR